MPSLTAAFTGEIIELRPDATESDLQVVIRAIYKQILGNVHVLSGQNLEDAESQLRNGQVTVKGFIRQVAQSSFYKSLFFEGNPAYRFIELNCKHLLGRAPIDQAEISQHVTTYNSQGYEADIDSYLESDEYNGAFGENIVPYPRCVNSQTGIKNNVFNQTISLLDGYATSDGSNAAKLTSSLASNSPAKIKVSSSRGGTTGSTNKRFRLSVTKAGITPIAKQSNATYEVGYKQLSQKIQNIQKTGGKILSIDEVV